MSCILPIWDPLATRRPSHIVTGWATGDGRHGMDLRQGDPLAVAGSRVDWYVPSRTRLVSVSLFELHTQVVSLGDIVGWEWLGFGFLKDIPPTKIAGFPS